MYFLSATSDPVVTCSSGAFSRIDTSDSPTRSRSFFDSRSIAPSSSPSPWAVSRTAVSTWPSPALTRLAERT